MVQIKTDNTNIDLASPSFSAKREGIVLPKIPVLKP